MLKMYTTALIIISIALGLAIVLQLLYIHTQLQITRDSILQKGYEAKQLAVEVSQQESRMRIYSIIIDFKTTRLIRGRKITEIQTQLNKTKTSLPYVCDTDVKSFQATFNKVGLLVTNVTEGSSSLMTDISNGHVVYVVISNKVYMITIDNEVRNILDVFDVNGDVDFSNKYLFILYSIANHDLVDKTNFDSSCRFVIHPFMGTIIKNSGSDYNIDLNVELFPDNPSDEVLTHIVGYRTV